MTNPGEDFEARLTRVLKAGAEELPSRPDRATVHDPHALASVAGRGEGPCARKVAIIGIAVGLGLTGTAAAATIVHLTSAPVTENDLAAATQSTASLEAMTFRGVSVPLPAPLARPHRSPTPSRPARSFGQTGSLLPARERR